MSTSPTLGNLEKEYTFFFTLRQASHALLDGTPGILARDARRHRKRERPIGSSGEDKRSSVTVDFARSTRRSKCTMRSVLIAGFFPTLKAAEGHGDDSGGGADEAVRPPSYNNQSRADLEDTLRTRLT